VTSEHEAVKVLVPVPLGPVVAPRAELKTVSKAVRQPIYWAGPRKGSHYELTRTSTGNSYVRYLPRGVKGGKQGRLLIVATYPLRDAFARVKKYANGKPIAGPNGSIYAVNRDVPTSVYIAFPKVDYEIEVYDPSPKVARTVAASGQVQSVR
jgi:hypothetical protein